MFNEEENQTEENKTEENTPVDYHTPEEKETSKNPFEPKPKNSKKTTILISAVLAVAAISIVVILLLKSSDQTTEEALNPITPSPSITNVPLSPDDTAQTTPTNTPEPTTTPTIELIKSGTATLGQYKGLSATMQSAKVTDAEIQDALNDFLDGLAKFVPIEGKEIVEDGDTLDINFEGLVDGEAFENGSAENYSLTIGSGSFIEGFEEGLIGTKVGEKVTLNLTFPDNYAEELAGKDVVFHVTINAITELVTPTLSDDLIVENTEYTTIDEYKKSVRESLKESKEADAESQMKNDILMQAVENATYPEDINLEIDSYNEQQKANNDAMANSYFGVDAVTFFTSSYGMTEEEYEAYMLETATSQVKLRKVLEAVAAAENLTLTDEEYEKGIEDLILNFGYESKEQLLELNKEEDIKNALLSEKAQNLIIDSAVIN